MVVKIPGPLLIPKAMETQVSCVKWCSTTGPPYPGVSQITVESPDAEPEADQLYSSSIMIVCLYKKDQINSKKILYL